MKSLHDIIETLGYIVDDVDSLRSYIETGTMHNGSED